MVTFVSRNRSSITELPKFVGRERSFSRLTVSRSFGFLLPRLSYCSPSIGKRRSVWASKAKLVANGCTEDERQV